MLKPKFIPLVLKQVIRHRTRTLLTVAGVATAMFLFCAVQAMQAGVERATQQTAADTTLVVYRENRFCPATSRLPEYYGDRIAKIPGVVSVVPMRVDVTNCRTSLDVITFRGVPPEAFAKSYATGLRYVAGSLQEWMSRDDAALLGETLANRRGLRIGDRFDAFGVNVYVAGIIRSDQPQDLNVGYVHLPFLQRSSGARRLGIVTQFNVKVADAGQLEAVADAIDAEFARDPDPTRTSPEKAFVARAAGDVVEIVRFTRWLGWGCLAAVLALVGNAIVLSVQDRVREHAILQTLGYRSTLIAKMIVAESSVLALLGGTLGTLGAAALLRWKSYSLSTEGLSIGISLDTHVLALGLLLSVLLGVAAGLVPAWRASRQEITASFRAV
jgi:putative ABC transport system permease protein